jgi:tol-pal system protein YbgF
MKAWNRRVWGCAVLLLAVALEGGCWGSMFWHMPAETMTTSTKVDSLLKENALLKERISGLEKSLRESEERSRGTNAELRMDLDELKDQLNTLQELIRESLESTPFTPAQRPKPARADTSHARVTLPATASALAMGTGAPRGDTLKTAQGQSATDSLARTAGAADTAGAVEAPAPPPEEMFRQIYRDYNRREYQLALEEGSSFLEEYPEDPLCEDVLFIRGECLSEQTAYVDALKEFSTLLQRYPKGRRAPGALLRMAVAYDAMGQKELAAGVVRRLLHDFPNSDEAKAAEEQFAPILKE